MNQLKIITKNEWLGSFARGHVQTHHPSKITFHHQGPEDGFENIHRIPCFEGAATIRKIQKEHMNKYGLADIKYHYIIAPNGDIYEGRPPHYLGKHVSKNNRDNIGVMVIGNFCTETPTQAQIDSIKKLIIYISFLFPRIDIPKCIYGHRDFEFDICPGDSLYNIINDIKYGKISLFE